LLNWEGYEEKYLYNFEDMYEVVDNNQAEGIPSKWSFTTTVPQNHSNALS